MSTVNKMLNLELEREFNASAKSVFEAIKAGVLFVQCSAIQSTMKIDFKEGGEYYLSFGPDGEVSGKFTKIVPVSTVAFTWGNDTQVHIAIEAKGEKSKLKLTHSKIPDEQWLNDYRGGWEHGLSGLKSEMKA